jgi:hypothetical protein
MATVQTTTVVVVVEQTLEQPSIVLMLTVLLSQVVVVEPTLGEMMVAKVQELVVMVVEPMAVMELTHHLLAA